MAGFSEDEFSTSSAKGVCVSFYNYASCLEAVWAIYEGFSLVLIEKTVYWLERS